MANNFLGRPFSPWVKKQIDVRQSALGEFNNIDEKYLKAYSTKTPFLRLASSVNLTKKGSNGQEITDSVYQKLINAGLTEDQISGDKLAKNFILQGGVVSSTGKESYSGLQAGLNNLTNPFNGAYGWGGISERGYVPMPGITNADVIFYNNGALSKTTINVKCFSKAQFQLLDVLYLRPGYTLLMEFGWSQYLNKENELTSMDTFYTGPMSALLKGDVNQYKLYNLIDEYREVKQGNYDAVFGKISKFNWQFNTDGSYDCQIQLTAIGDVIESLKININGINETEKTEGEKENTNPSPPLIANKNKSLLNKMLVDVYDKSKKIGSAKPTLIDWKLNGLLDETGKINNPTYKNSLLIVPVKATDDETNLSPQVYMKYGALMAYIQAKLLLYCETTSTPIVTFDMDLQNLDDDDNVILTFPGQFSGNPKTCLIPYTNAADPQISIPDSPLNKVLKKTKFNYKNNIYLGRLSNIMVNINYIESSFSSQIQDEEGNIKLLDFLKSLNKGIIQSLGGVNKFNCRLSDSGLKIRFIEDIPQRFTNPPPQEEYTRFNIFGVKPGINGSFIRSINLTADISNDFSSMVSIGAQSNANQISANATSFSNYNAGLKDRIIPSKLSSVSVKATEGKKSTPKEEAQSNFNTNIYNSTETNQKLFTNIYVNLNFLQENLTALTSHNYTHAKLLLGILTDATKDESPQLDAPFFLPFNLTLEMDGISGIKLYEKFLITDDVLPPSYQNDNVDIQITSVNHNINNDAWTTKLETLSMSANKNLGTPKRPAQQTSSDTSQYTSTGTAKPLPPPSNIEPPTPDSPDSVERVDAMQNSYDATFQRDGEVSGLCAQWVYNLAVNYVKYLEGQTINSSKLKAGGNANNNQEFYNNLTKIGYIKSISTGISKISLIKKLKTTTFGYGDVVCYYANDKPIVGSESHYRYGHAQIYVGDINSSGWSTSKKENYGTSFVYSSRTSFNWNILIFRAPETA